jgi:hypothetical protein
MRRYAAELEQVGTGWLNYDVSDFSPEDAWVNLLRTVASGLSKIARLARLRRIYAAIRASEVTRPESRSYQLPARCVKHCVKRGAQHPAGDANGGRV